jgi:hypothetical protein
MVAHGFSPRENGPVLILYSLESPKRGDRAFSHPVARCGQGLDGRVARSSRRTLGLIVTSTSVAGRERHAVHPDLAVIFHGRRCFVGLITTASWLPSNSRRRRVRWRHIAPLAGFA